MYSPHLYRPLATARIDDLRRNLAVSRGRHLPAIGPSKHGSCEPPRGAPTNPIRALAVRFGR